MDFITVIHQRRSIRMVGYDNTLPGAYFVTLISRRRICLFGEITSEEMDLNPIGQKVIQCWYSLLKNFQNVELDEFVLMPNHLHGIIVLLDAFGKGEAFPEMVSSPKIEGIGDASPLRPRGTESGSLGAIIQNFKSMSTRMVNKMYYERGNKIWQRNYYERIIRNESEFNAIRKYIWENPLNWGKDQENPFIVK
jgi:REP element-mobilizing transposase RayT